MIQFLTFLLALQYALLAHAAPLPLILTRVHTAAPVTVMQTVTTGTTTLMLPPVEILVSDGVTYTFTHTESPAGVPTTTTVVKPAATQQAQNTPAQTTTQAEDAQTQAAQTQTQAAATTQAQTQPAQTQTNQAPTTPTTQTTQAETTQAETTQAETTSTTEAETLTLSAASGDIAAPSAIVYSPYADDRNCKAPSEIILDLKMINGKGIKNIRVYGTDCHTLDTVLPTCSSLGMKVNQGFWISPAGVDSIDDSVSDFLAYAKKNGFGVIDFITVGNEAVNSNHCSVSDLISKIGLVKSQLKSAGYSGQVTTSEPPVTFINNPELCTKSGIDFVGINPHSYFDTQMYASDAGDYVTDRQAATAKACNNMLVKITETGYPSQGSSNGNNVPTPENQATAVKSIIQKTGGDVTILTTFNDFWKDPGPYGIEQYFGVIELFE